MGGIILRILLLAIAIFVTIHFIRIDFLEGTIPTNAAFTHETPCDPENETNSIPITSIEGDTIESLFALYPDPELTFIDRLELFYQLNPHLQKQQIVKGDKINLPLTNKVQEKCNNPVF